MPITPDQPFPKKQGDNIRSKDWNDAVNELIRLDTAKLTLATGGALSGPLSINTPATVSPVVNLKQTTPSWNTADIYKDFRYIRTEFAGSVTDGPFRQFNVGAGGVSIGYPNVPTLGSGDALYVNGNVGIGTASVGGMRLVVDTGGGTASSLKCEHRGSNFVVRPNGAGSTTTVIENTGGGALLINPGGGNVGLGTTDPGSLRMLIAGITGWNTGLGLTGNSTGGIGLSIENTTTGGHKYVLISGGTGNGPGNLNGAFGLYDDSVNAYRLVVDAGGQLGVGVGDPGFRLDVLGRARFREGGGSAGHWLYQSGADRAFIGLQSDTSVGLWGNAGANWGLTMNTSSGHLTLLASSKPINVTAIWQASPDNVRNVAEICNDTTQHKVLMIVGNRSWGGSERRVGIWDQLFVGGTLIAQSDVRTKEEVRPLKDSLASILALRGVSFKWRRDAGNDKPPTFGLIAQEVEKVYPELVTDGPDGVKALNYQGLIGPLVEAIKQQHEMISELRAEVQGLKAGRDN